MSRRWRRLGIATAALVIVGITGLTWGLAVQARTPRQLAANAEAPPASTITVPVEVRTLVRTAALDCGTEASVVVPLLVTVPEGSESPIVTALPLGHGDNVREGQAVVGISGRPVMVIVGKLPAYRDLSGGLRGPDVVQLQAALVRIGVLSGKLTGKFDKATMRAVTKLYARNGYQPLEHDVTLPRGELLVVPRLPLKVGAVHTKLGAAVKNGDLTLVGGKARLRCTTSEPDVVSALRKGAKGTVTGPGDDTPGTVVKIVEGKKSESDDGNSTPTTTVFVSVVKPLKIDGTYRANIELERAPNSGPIVPSSALWARPGGKTVVRVVKDGRTTDVEVVPGFELEGQILVRPVNGELGAGDEVLVSAEAAQDQGEGQ